MMWSNTLTTFSTISLPLRLRSTFHQLLNMVARATWFDGSHCYKVFRKWSRTHSVLSSETPSKKERLEFGNQRLNRFQQLDPMAGGKAINLASALVSLLHQICLVNGFFNGYNKTNVKNPFGGVGVTLRRNHPFPFVLAVDATAAVRPCGSAESIRAVVSAAERCHFQAFQKRHFRCCFGAAVVSPIGAKFEHHSSAIQASLQVPSHHFRRRREWRNRGCTLMDAACPNCGDDHIATGKDAARLVGRGMHGAIGLK
ncbi:hypothetical protein CK203_056897 [Vitis vinifera]|uniref:Uncharacterized protein n=1 Tax=Vitis vinifera TaxID=29760 RepID=A0A438GW80_VITVI|nr:hypothetical protein CK203_056897 [Vitis vinifera]